MAQSTEIGLNYFLGLERYGERSKRVAAFSVWRDYQPLFEGKGRSVFREVKRVINNCSSADDLDIALDRITSSGESPSFMNGGREGREDGNDIANGRYAIARKALEDGVQ